AWSAPARRRATASARGAPAQSATRSAVGPPSPRSRAIASRSRAVNGDPYASQNPACSTKWSRSAWFTTEGDGAGRAWRDSRALPRMRQEYDGRTLYPSSDEIRDDQERTADGWGAGRAESACVR